MLLSMTFFRNVLLVLLALTSSFSCHASPNSTQDNQQLKATRLVTDAEHKMFLIHTLQSAQRSVMISSHDISPKIFQEDNIGQFIINTANRGVAVYIYVDHEADFYGREYDLLQKLKQVCKYAINSNHSKCLMRDNEMVAVGSYNWLSPFSNTSTDASIVTKGPLAKSLKDDIWEGMRFYQSIQHNNISGISSFCRDRYAFRPKKYDISGSSSVTILRTPEAHHVLLTEVFQGAQHSITIFSPFIRLERLQEVLCTATLMSLNARHVQLTVVSLPQPCRDQTETGQIFTYLEQMHKDFPCFSFQTQKDFHAKSVISDHLICEGSFNWLSAVNETAHNANNYEVSLAFDGDNAVSLIESYHASKLGQICDAVSAYTSEVYFSDEVSDSKEHLEQPQKKRERTPEETDTVSPHKPRIKQSKTEDTITIKICSPKKTGLAGYALKTNGEFLRDTDNTVPVYPTKKAAKRAAYAFFQ